MLFHCTHGRDDPERAIVPFIAANVAAASGQEALVVLTVEGAWLCKRGYADSVRAEGFPDLAELVASFVEAGGRIWGCSACTTPAASPRPTWSPAPRSWARPRSSPPWPKGRSRSPWGERC